MSKARMLAAILVLSLSPDASAEAGDLTRAAARTLGSEGVDSFQAGDYASAAEKLDRAFRALKVPTLGLWSARAFVKVGKLVDASERYLEVTRLDPKTGDVSVQKQAIADATTEQAALASRIPTFTLNVSAGEGELTVTLDGAVVPPTLVGAAIPANPGQHTLEVSRGVSSATKQFQLEEGKRLVLDVELESAPAGVSPAAEPTVDGAPSASAKPGSRQFPTLGWVSLAVGGVGVALGATTGAMALSKGNELEPSCPNSRCVRSKADEMNSYNTLRTVSTLGFIVGGVGLAGAGVLFFTAPRQSSQAARLTPLIGPTSVGVAGAF